MNKKSFICFKKRKQKDWISPKKESDWRIRRPKIGKICSLEFCPTCLCYLGNKTLCKCRKVWPLCERASEQKWICSWIFLIKLLKMQILKIGLLHLNCEPCNSKGLKKITSCVWLWLFYSILQLLFLIIGSWCCSVNSLFWVELVFSLPASGGIDQCQCWQAPQLPCTNVENSDFLELAMRW